jgi:spore coat protein U-like protein
VSNSKGQFALGFIVSAICIIHVVCVALLVGMSSSTAAQIDPAAVSCSVQSAPAPNVDKATIIAVQCSSATPHKISLDAETAADAIVVVRKLSDSDTSANYLLRLDGEHANTANNTVRVTVTY